MLDSSGDYKGSSKSIKSKGVDETASNRDLFRFPFHRPGKVPATRDGPRLEVGPAVFPELQGSRKDSGHSP